MPRNRPRRPNGATPAGPVMPVAAPAQPAMAATGQDYGAAGAQLAAQQAMPLPDMAAMSAPPVDPETAAMGMEPPDPAMRLNAPSMRPDEPVTAGLPSGPGPGPEALGVPNIGPIAQLLREVAAITGAQDLAQIARDAEQQGV